MEGEIVVLLFLTRGQCIPPLSQYLADGAVVVVGVFLVHQSAVSLTEDHERIHRPTNVVTIVALRTKMKALIYMRLILSIEHSRK